MEVESITPSGLVAAAAEAATINEEVIQPLFADTVEPVAPEEADNSEADNEESSSADDESSASETSSVAQGLNPVPTEMRQWMDEIDNIEYHYRHDDDDRGYNFFRDPAGNTLMIQEFDVKGERFFNINREIIMKQSDLFNLYDAVKTPEGVNATIFGQKLLRGCSTDLLVEALSILADTSSDASSDTSSEEEPEPQPSPIPTKGDADAIQRFLVSCFLVLIFLKFFGCITKFA